MLPLKIISWNVHGIISKIQPITDMLTTEDPAVAFFTETHLKYNQCGALTSHTPNERNKQNGKTRKWIFNCAGTPSTDPAGISLFPGGICATISAPWSDIVHYGPPPTSSLLKGYVISLDFCNPGQQKFMRIIGIYIPPYSNRTDCNNTAIRLEAMKYLSAECASEQQARSTRKEYRLIITGDFNATLFDSDRSSNESYSVDKTWRQFTTQCNLKPFDRPSPGQARAYTYEHTLPNQGMSFHRIDDFLTPNDIILTVQHHQQLIVAPLSTYDGFSDHLPILLTIPDAQALGMRRTRSSSNSPAANENDPGNPPTPQICLPIAPVKLNNFKLKLIALHDRTCAFASETIGRITAKLQNTEPTDPERDELVKQVDAALMPVLQGIYNVGISTCGITYAGARGAARAESTFFNRPESLKYKKHMLTMSLCRKALVKARACGPTWSTTHAVLRLVKHNAKLIPPSNATDQRARSAWFRSVLAVRNEAAQQVRTLCSTRARKVQNRLSTKFSHLLFSNRRKAYRDVREPEAIPRLTSIRPAPGAETISDRELFLKAVAEGYSDRVQARPNRQGETNNATPMPCSFEAQLNLRESEKLDPFNLRTARDSAAPDAIINTTLSTLLKRSVFDRLLSESPNRRAAGPDGIPMELIKHLPDEFKDLIFEVFCLQARLHRTCPSWKTSDTILLFKRGDPTLLENYRPIGLLSALSKLWTACLAETLTDFCEQTGILSDSQCGFRPERRPLQHIVHLMSVIEDALSKDQDLYVLYMDLKDAFGSVDHARLHQVLNKLGIPPDFLSIIKDLYTDRTTCIRTIHGTTSPIKCLRGTVQGDCLSPLLFILYLEPLLQWFAVGKDGYCVPNVDYVHNGAAHDVAAGPFVDCSDALCADDLALTARSETGLLRMVRKVQLYCEWARIEINVGKCAVSGRESDATRLAAEEPIQTRLSRITINNQPMQFLPAEKSYKYLGVHLSLDLSPTHHFNYLKRQIDDLFDAISAAPILDIDMRMVIEELVVSKIDFTLQCGILTAKQITELGKQVETQIKISAYRLPLRHPTECLYLPSQAGGLCFPNLENNAKTYAALAYESALNNTGRLGRVTRSVVSDLLSSCHFDLNCIKDQSTSEMTIKSIWARRIRLALSGGFALGRVAPITAPPLHEAEWHATIATSCLTLEPNDSKRWVLLKKMTILRNAGIIGFKTLLEAPNKKHNGKITAPEYHIITTLQLKKLKPTLSPKALETYELIRRKYGKRAEIRQIWDPPWRPRPLLWPNTDGYETRPFRDKNKYKKPLHVLSSRTTVNGEHHYLIKWSEDNGPNTRPWWCPSDSLLLKMPAVQEFNRHALYAPPQLGHPLLPFNEASILDRIEVSTTSIRPDLDIAPLSPIRAHTMHLKEDLFYFHDERGHICGVLDEQVVISLWDKYTAVRNGTWQGFFASNGKTSVPSAEPVVPSKRHNAQLDTENDNTPMHNKRAEHEQSFIREVALLLCRYRNGEMATNSATKKVELKNHWKTPPAILSALQMTFDCYTEMFASPLNVHPDTKNYYSAFSADEVFGANEDAYSRAWTSLPSAIYFNPEYTSDALLRAVQWALAGAAQTKTPFLAVGVLPKWPSQKYNALLRSGSNQTHILATIPRKYFNFIKADYIPKDPRITSRDQHFPTENTDADYEIEPPPHAHWPVQVVLFFNHAGLFRRTHENERFQTNLEELRNTLITHMLATAPGTTRLEAAQKLIFNIPLAPPTTPSKSNLNWGSKFRRQNYPCTPHTLQQDTVMTDASKDTDRSIMCRNLSLRSPRTFAQHNMSLAHDQRQIIFCDASKQDGQPGLGIGIWHETTNTNTSLLIEEVPNDNITVGELLAILHAVRNPPPTVTTTSDMHILTDSLTGLQTIARVLHKPRHNATSYCDTIAAELIKIASTRTGRTTFGKVPAHVGVFGNEQADKLAKAALLSKPNADKYPEAPLITNKALRFRLCLPNPLAADPCEGGSGAGGARATTTTTSTATSNTACPANHAAGRTLQPLQPYGDTPLNLNPSEKPMTRADGIAHIQEANLKRLAALPATITYAKNARRLAQAAISQAWRPTNDLFTTLHERGANRHWPSRRRCTLQVLHGSLPCQRTRARWTTTTRNAEPTAEACICLLCKKEPDDAYHCALTCSHTSLSALRTNRWKTACNKIISAVHRGDKGGFAILSSAGPHKQANLKSAARTAAATNNESETEQPPPTQHPLQEFLGRLCNTCPNTSCTCPTGPRTPSILLIDGWVPPPGSFNLKTNSIDFQTIPKNLLPSPETQHNIRLIPVNIIYCDDAGVEAAVKNSWATHEGLLRSLRDAGWTVVGHANHEPPTATRAAHAGGCAAASEETSTSSSNILTIPLGACGTTFESSTIALRALGLSNLSAARALQLSLSRITVNSICDIVKKKRSLEANITQKTISLPRRKNRRHRSSRDPTEQPDDMRGQDEGGAQETDAASPQSPAAATTTLQIAATSPRSPTTNAAPWTLTDLLHRAPATKRPRMTAQILHATTDPRPRRRNKRNLQPPHSPPTPNDAARTAPPSAFTPLPDPHNAPDHPHLSVATTANPRTETNCPRSQQTTAPRTRRQQIVTCYMNPPSPRPPPRPGEAG